MKTENTARNEVEIPSGKQTINANIEIPEGAKGIVLFAHGSGSSRFSPRNNYVAQKMNRRGLATLLIDLLTSEEESVDEYTGQYRFDIDLLAERLVDATRWLKKNPLTQNLSIGYFGSSTGAAAALIAATKIPEVKAVVSRGGRPDLAKEYLAEVKAPTLLIVGGDDTEIIELNMQALVMLQTEKQLEIVPGATHLFEEPGKLGQVSELAANWFSKHL